jgi:hypothetical protein
LNTVMFLPHGKDLTIASAFFGTAASLAWFGSTSLTTDSYFIRQMIVQTCLQCFSAFLSPSNVSYCLRYLMYFMGNWSCRERWQSKLRMSAGKVLECIVIMFANHVYWKSLAHPTWKVCWKKCNFEIPVPYTPTPVHIFIW